MDGLRKMTNELLIGLIATQTAGMLGKIVWDWLNNKSNNNNSKGRCVDEKCFIDISENVNNTKRDVSENSKDIDNLKDQMIRLEQNLNNKFDRLIELMIQNNALQASLLAKLDNQ